MDESNLKFVIVGHVDHGKSTLIGRLLYDTDSLPPDKIEEIKKTSQDLGRQTEFAYLLDHLEEERQQRVTIDITQVFFKTKKRQYVIIDAPGHVEFVKNMITGASQAEAAVLIVDVQEGIQEQTKRHAYILSLLGLNQVIVVLNKMDLAGFKEERFNEVKRKIQGLLNTLNIKPDFFVPISAIGGENIAQKSKKMGWYTGPNFLEILDTLKNRESVEGKPLIFPVQDVYSLDAKKRIIVGRIEAGMVKQGGTIKILPSNYTTRVVSIEKYLDKRDLAYAGESTGITIEDPAFLNRGDVICLPHKEPVLTERFSGNIFWMAKQDFRKEQRITIRCATQETSCQIESIRRRVNSSTFELIEEDAKILKNLEVGEVIIKTKKPLVIKTFNDVQELGRFVLVQGDNICAGGIITTVN
ncbi:sulfate adenylyltransferase subunit 1 [Candidatus Omnitrophota bacterium]